MYLSQGLLHWDLESYIKFANNWAINFGNSVFIGEVIAVGASYLAIVTLSKTARENRAKFLDAVRPGKKGAPVHPFGWLVDSH